MKRLHFKIKLLNTKKVLLIEKGLTNSKTTLPDSYERKKKSMVILTSVRQQVTQYFGK